MISQSESSIKILIKPLILNLIIDRPLIPNGHLGGVGLLKKRSNLGGLRDHHGQRVQSDVKVLVVE